MGLSSVLKKLSQENFDAKKGKINGREELPDGKYTVILKGVTHSVGKNSNQDFLMFSLQVLEGEHAGAVESIFPTLAETTSKGNPMPDFVLDRSVKTIKVIGAMVGLNVPDECFLSSSESENYENIAQAFQNANVIGETLMMSITSSPNKKNPDQPYRNYEFTSAEKPKAVEVTEDPFADTSNAIEITDDDLPFN